MSDKEHLNSSGKSFLRGALFLTLGMMTVKVIGALFKIPLSNMITEEGMGYFSTAYSFYNVLFSITASGLPVAVSRTVSESCSLGDSRAARRVLYAALPLFMAIGVCGTLVMLLFAPFYTNAVENSGALLPMLMLAPSILLCCVSSAIRGYFEGMCDMLPTTVSQVLEAAVKLALGLTGAEHAMRYGAKIIASLPFSGCFQVRNGYALGAAGGIAGVTLGSAVSALYLVFNVIGKKSEKKQDDRDGKGFRSTASVSKRLLLTALPTTLGAAAVSLSGLIDSSFMQTGTAKIMNTAPSVILEMYSGSIPKDVLEVSSSISNYLFGCYNMALTLFMLVPSVTQAFAMSALPSVTRAYTKGSVAELKKAVETVLRVTFMFAVPAGLGLSVLAKPAALLIYGERPGTEIIARALEIMGVASIFAAVTTPLGSIMQAVGHIELPVWINMLGLVIKVVLNFRLVGIPQLNILGGGISTLISYFVIAALEILMLNRAVGLKIDLKRSLMLPLIAGSMCAAYAKATYRVQCRFTDMGRYSALFPIIVAVIIYTVTLIITGTIGREDIDLLRAGEKNTKRCRKHLKKQGG